MDACRGDQPSNPRLTLADSLALEPTDGLTWDPESEVVSGTLGGHTVHMPVMTGPVEIDGVVCPRPGPLRNLLRAFRHSRSTERNLANCRVERAARSLQAVEVHLDDGAILTGTSRRQGWELRRLVPTAGHAGWALDPGHPEIMRLAEEGRQWVKKQRDRD